MRRQAWSPMQEMLRLRGQIDQALTDALHAPRPRSAPAAVRGVPTLDLCETPTQYVVRVDVPGVSRERLAVSVTDDTLVVRGERPALAAPEGATLLRQERVRGPFRRTLMLPPAADSGAVQARLADGVLEVRIGKRVPDQGRDVPIEAA